MSFLSYEAPGWVPGTSDIYKQDLLKEFFVSMQIDPSQVRITFYALHSKFQKKNLSACDFFTFSFRFGLHLVRGFQKGITLRVLCPETHPQPHPPDRKSVV